MAIWLVIQGDKVTKAAWSSNGCLAMIAAASAIAELSENQDASNLKGITTSDVTDLIGGLPEGKEYAAEMAIELLQSAIEEKRDG